MVGGTNHLELDGRAFWRRIRPDDLSGLGRAMDYLVPGHQDRESAGGWSRARLGVGTLPLVRTARVLLGHLESVGRRRCSDVKARRHGPGLWRLTFTSRPSERRDR